MNRIDLARSFCTATMVLVAACSSTKVTTWQDVYQRNMPIRKTLVVAAVPSDAVRRRLEDQLVMELAKRDIDAAQSYRYLPRAVDREAVRNILDREGYDSVMVTRYVGSVREISSVPSVSYYTYIGRSTASPETFEVRRAVKFETRLFSTVGPERLLWAAATESIDPATPEKMSRKVAEKLIDRMDDELALRF